MEPSGSAYAWIHSLLSELTALSSEGDKAALLGQYRSAHTSEADAVILQDAEAIADLLLFPAHR